MVSSWVIRKPLLSCGCASGHSPTSCVRRRRPGTSGAPRLPSVSPNSVATANSRSALAWPPRLRLLAASRSGLHAACRETRTGPLVQSRRTSGQNARDALSPPTLRRGRRQRPGCPYRQLGVSYSAVDGRSVARRLRKRSAVSRARTAPRPTDLGQMSRSSRMATCPLGDCPLATSCSPLASISGPSSDSSSTRKPRCS